MTKFINFKKRNDETYALKIMGAIGDWWDDYVYDGNTIDTTIRDKLESLPPSVKKIEIYINSPGGSVSQGISIYNQLRASGLHITTYNLGEASSIASIIFLAGHTRVMPEGTFSLLHQPAHLVYQNVKQAEQHLQQLKSINESLKSIYLKHLNISSEELDKMLENETIINNDEALKLGFSTSKDLPTEIKIDETVAYADRINNTQNFLKVQNNLCLTKTYEIENLNEVNLMDDSTIVLMEAKLQAVEAAKASLEQDFLNYKNSNPTIDITEIKKQAKIEALAEIKNIEDLRVKAINVGFKAEGDNLREIMINVLVEGGVSTEKLSNFDDSALETLCDYVISNKKQIDVSDDYKALADKNETDDAPKASKNMYASLNKAKTKGK